MHSGSDLELTRRCAAGEEAAWRELFRRFLPAIRGAVARVLLPSPFYSPAEVDEAALQVIEEFWRRRKKQLGAFRGDCPLSQWLALSADRIARFRRNASHPLPEEPAGPEGSEGPALVEQKELQKKVAELLASLPPEDRALLEETVLRNRQYSDLAREKGLPLTTLIHRLRRIKEKLRSVLFRDGLFIFL